MTKSEKFLEKFKTSPQNVRFAEIKQLAESLGYRFREGKGSYIVCYKNEIMVISFPVHNGDCKNSYKKKFLKIITP